MRKTLIICASVSFILAGCTKPDGTTDWLKTSALVVGVLVLGSSGGGGITSIDFPCVRNPNDAQPGQLICPQD